MAKYMIIDGIRADFDQEKNILQVINSVGIHVPTLCYYSDLSIYGACRMCMVEDERGNLIASCSTPPKDKMVIRTNTPRLQHHRKMILELLLAAHCRDCNSSRIIFRWCCSPPTAATAPSVRKTRPAVFRSWRAALALLMSVSPIREKHSPWMIPQFPSSGIPANASFAATASGYVMRYST